MANEESGVENVIPSIIVRHTSRRLGKLSPCEACERLVSGSISFSEFVDQVGDGYREILEFMMEHDLHPGRPDEVLFCIDFQASLRDRARLLGQFAQLLDEGCTQQAG